MNPICIDLIMANEKNDFMKLTMFEFGLSDHHKLITTVKTFVQKKFKTELKRILDLQKNLNYSSFQAVFQAVCFRNLTTLHQLK